MAKKYSRAWWSEEVDDLWSEIIKLKAGYLCEETRTNKNLQSAHIIRRNYRNTRWDLDNGICLTWHRHKWYTHYPLEWEIFVDELRGRGFYDGMKKKALIRKQWRLSEIKKLYAEFKAHRDSLLK